MHVSATFYVDIGDECITHVHLVVGWWFLFVLVVICWVEIELTMLQTFVLLVDGGSKC